MWSLKLQCVEPGNHQADSAVPSIKLLFGGIGSGQYSLQLLCLGCIIGWFFISAALSIS